MCVYGKEPTYRRQYAADTQIMKHTILILGLGNDILGDDGVGICAARALAPELAGVADVVETAMHGLALLECFLGYEKAILIDAIHTRAHPPGTILDIDPATITATPAPSPHYTGLPEMLVLADQLHLDFPKALKIFAMETVDPYSVSEALTPEVERALPALLERVRAQVRAWTAGTPAG